MLNTLKKTKIPKTIGYLFKKMLVTSTKMLDLSRKVRTMKKHWIYHKNVGYTIKNLGYVQRN